MIKAKALLDTAVVDAIVKHRHKRRRRQMPNWVEKHIPAGINEAFNISENMAMWEDEQATEEDSNDAE
jgi:hypothetical protein